MDEEFSQDKVPASNWFKFDKIGDQVIGTLTEKYHKDGMGDFKPQEVYVLTNCTKVVMGGKKQTETDYNVGVSSEFINNRLKNVKEGDRIGFKFEKEIPAKVKGHHPAKSLIVNSFGHDDDYKPKINFED